jgi:hypothetical protein
MNRAVVIGASVVILAVVGTIGAGIGFIVLSSDPAIQIQRQCAAGQMGPPGSCKNLVITRRTRDRVEYTFDLGDGTHCGGYQQVRGRGLFGLTITSEGGSTCPGPGVPPVGPGGTMVFPDGNPACTNVSLVGAPTARGFQVAVTNSSNTACEIAPIANVLFLDAGGQPLNIDLQVSPETSSSVVLQPGAAAIYAFDGGTAGCQAPAAILFIDEAGAQQLASPGRICSPVVEHPARRAA